MALFEEIKADMPEIWEAEERALAINTHLKRCTNCTSIIHKYEDERCPECDYLNEDFIQEEIMPDDFDEPVTVYQIDRYSF